MTVASKVDMVGRERHQETSMTWRIVVSGGFLSAVVGALAGGVADDLMSNGEFAVLATAIGAAIGSAVGWHVLQRRTAAHWTPGPSHDAEQTVPASPGRRA